MAVSLHVDGELVAADHDNAEPTDDAIALEAHTATCPSCADFQRSLQRMRTALRFEPVDAVPDLAPTVLARLSSQDAPPPRHVSAAKALARLVSPDAPPHRNVSPRRRRPLVVAAALAAIAGVAAGAVFVGVGSEPQSPAAADLPDRVLAAQAGITSLDARFTLEERGLRADPSQPRFAGRLRYVAPESLGLTLRERSGTRPSPAEEASVRLVVDGDRWWQSTPRDCSPVPGRVRCPDDALRWVRSVTGREPFADSAPVPLELITPVDSFALAATPVSLGTRTIAGRPAIGVRVSAAQVAPLLDGLSPGGDLRPVHPGDPVEMWLDEQHLATLELVVRASDDDDRARWAAAQNVTDKPGDRVVAFTVESVAINEPIPDDAFTPPDASTVDEHIEAGFRPDGSVRFRSDGSGGFRSNAEGDPVPVAPAPADLPPGFRPYRSGTTVGTGGPTVAVASWTNGRAWLTVRATAEWSGNRLFGGLGGNVRRIDLGGAGVGYVSDDGRKLALHTDDLDVLVAGSVPARQLRAAAGSLGVTGQPVPATWDEAATASLAEAAAVNDGLLTAPDLDGFGPPAVRIAGATTTQVYAGAGDREFTLAQSGASHLTPPSDGHTVGVTVRGVPGRYHPERGELEWAEAGKAYSLSSRSLSLRELLDIAANLQRPR